MGSDETKFKYRVQFIWFVITLLAYYGWIRVLSLFNGAWPLLMECRHCGERVECRPCTHKINRDLEGELLDINSKLGAPFVFIDVRKKHHCFDYKAIIDASSVKRVNSLEQAVYKGSR